MYASPPPPTPTASISPGTGIYFQQQYGVPTIMERDMPQNTQWTVNGLPSDIGIEEENTSGSNRGTVAIIILACILCCATAIVLAITLVFTNDDEKSGSSRTPDYTTEFQESIDTWNEGKAAKFRQGVVNGISTGISTSHVNIQRVFAGSTVVAWNLKNLNTQQVSDINAFLTSTVNTAILNKALLDTGVGIPIPSSTGLVSTHGNPNGASSPAPIDGCVDQPNAVTNADPPNCAVTIATGGTCPLNCLTGFQKSAEFQCIGSTWSTPTCTQTHCIIQPSNVSGGITPQCSLPAAKDIACTLSCETGMVATANYICNMPGWTTPACITITPTSTTAIATTSSTSSTRTRTRTNSLTGTPILTGTPTLTGTPFLKPSSTPTPTPSETATETSTETVVVIEFSSSL